MKPLTFTYKNWRGETATRRVRPFSIRWGATEWHPEETWLMVARDIDKDAMRQFVMSDMSNITAGTDYLTEGDQP